MSDRIYRIGVIGCGRIASTIDDEIDFSNYQITRAPMCHAGAYAEVPRTEIVAAAEVFEKKLQDFGQRWGVTHLYTDYEEMLAKEDLDIVSIGTRPQHHADITVKVAEVGVKGILCDKPLAVSMAEADRMVDVCEKHGVKTVTNHSRCWHPAYIKAKELLDNGAVGDLRTITTQARGGLLNMGTHLFHLMRLYAGDVAWVSGTVPNPTGGDDAGIATIMFESGVTGLVDSVNSVGFGLTLYGTAGFIIASDNWNGFRLFKYEEQPSTKRRGRDKLVEEPFPLPQSKSSNTVGAVNDIVALLDGELSMETYGNGVREGAATTEMGIAFHESHRQGGARVDLPLTNRDLQIRFK